MIASAPGACTTYQPEKNRRADILWQHLRDYRRGCQNCSKVAVSRRCSVRGWAWVNGRRPTRNKSHTVCSRAKDGCFEEQQEHIESLSMSTLDGAAARPGQVDDNRVPRGIEGETVPEGDGEVRYSFFRQSKVSYSGLTAKYEDSFLDKVFIWIFCRKLAEAAGVKGPQAATYDNFVDLSFNLLRQQSAQDQRQSVVELLKSLLPPTLPFLIRRIIPPAKWAAEMNANVTVEVFSWMVGPCERIPVPNATSDTTSGVAPQASTKAALKIKRCRYLQESGCVGMCVNMCKLPTQDFFTNEFGLPLHMKPNYEDLSCEMVFNELAPSEDLDEALQQPCFTTCASRSSKAAEAAVCHKVILPVDAHAD
ncbi:hypothetical protein CYMTET_17296 [Cymbomonas tetramitiformis]|uniref:Beta-carotene isomerase D27-like C-terminal domain-containing protein n=1 Tax=Cymbomonas tetramitiformis TaxID=36881 RepID=A0AAE0L735_9CHLO|nr:hypothetical protein CYMTET_17296 [Cymbomonas tetramitiformis]